MQTWEAITSRRNVRSFILITDREQLRELAGVWRGAGHVAGAAAARSCTAAAGRCQAPLGVSDMLGAVRQRTGGVRESAPAPT